MKKNLIIILFLSCLISCNKKVKQDYKTNQIYSTCDAARTIYIEEDGIAKSKLVYKNHTEGMNYMFKNKHKEAIICFKEALKYDTLNVTILNNIGLSELSLRNYYSANYYLSKAIEIDSTYYKSYVSKGLNLYYMGNYKEGINVLNKIKNKKLSDHVRQSLYYHLAMNYTRLKMCDSADYYFNLALTTNKTKESVESICNFIKVTKSKYCP